MSLRLLCSTSSVLPSSATHIAGELSYGERRALEFAIALAMQPKLLLLDEPMAGIGREESCAASRLLQRLKGRLPIVLIEHDMTTVFALADRISVLIYGRVLASGPPAQIRADPPGRRGLPRRRARMKPMLEVRGLAAGYGPAQVLFDVNLAVDAGEVVTLLGRNGMGKTTTINTIMGLCRRARARRASKAAR